MLTHKAKSLVSPNPSRRNRSLWIGVGFILLFSLLLPQISKAADRTGTDRFAYDVILTLDATPNPVNQGDPATILVQATGVDTSLIPTGTVEIMKGAEIVCLVTLNEFGAGSCTLTYPPVIMYPSAEVIQLKAIYPGESPFLPAVSDILDLTVQMPFPFETVYENDFELAAGDEWCLTDIATTPNGQTFLGEFNNTTTCLLLDSLPEHNWTRVSFDLYLIRSWNGNNEDYGPDEWLVSLGGAIPKTLLHTTFSNWPDPDFPQAFPGAFQQGNFPPRSGASASNALGYTYEGDDMDTTYQLSYIFFHKTDTLRLDFSALGLQEIENESWGLDNVVVMISNAPAYQNFLPTVSH